MEENHDPINREKAIWNDPTTAIAIHILEYIEEFGPLMLVKKPTRKRNIKNNNSGGRKRTTEVHNPSGPGPTRSRPPNTDARGNGKNVEQGEKYAQEQPSISCGSQYAVLDNITEDSHQENPGDIAMLETKR